MEQDHEGHQNGATKTSLSARWSKQTLNYPRGSGLPWIGEPGEQLFAAALWLSRDGGNSMKRKNEGKERSDRNNLVLLPTCSAIIAHGFFTIAWVC